jgi:hypothetical protein
MRLGRHCFCRVNTCVLIHAYIYVRTWTTPGALLRSFYTSRHGHGISFARLFLFSEVCVHQDVDVRSSRLLCPLPHCPVGRSLKIEKKNPAKQKTAQCLPFIFCFIRERNQYSPLTFSLILRANSNPILPRRKFLLLSRTSGRGGEGYCVKEGGGEEGEREREDSEHAVKVRLRYSLGY